ncbi:Flagellar biosynthetic protein FliQ [Chlamydiales bacterium SCGC AG-110-M15]|nr:Flagellar biosynthetic protein FliQ [Chlamydiales bacterium SCGC AG-110-M15]
MTPDQVTDLIRQALYTSMQISAPMLIVAMFVGFTISVFQSVTQINEMTLTFVPKILIFAATISIAFPWMLKTMIKFSKNILVDHWDKITELSKYAS